MAFLNLDLDFFTHPKTVRLVGLLGRGAEVLPIRLWCYCGKYHVEDGRLTGYSAQEIESAVGWWGKAGELMQALIHVGFVDELDGGLVVHDWKESQGHLLAFKVRGKAAATARWDKARCNKDASSIPHAYEKQCSLPTKPTKPTKKPPLSPPVGGERVVQRRKEGRRTDMIPHWQAVVAHISDTWEAKSRGRLRLPAGERLPFHWKAQYWASLRGLCTSYSAAGVMGLWDEYLEVEDSFVHQAAYSFEMFQAKITGLLVHSGWRTRRQSHEAKLSAPASEEERENVEKIAGVLNTIMSSSKGDKVADVQKTLKRVGGAT